MFITFRKSDTRRSFSLVAFEIRFPDIPRVYEEINQATLVRRTVFFFFRTDAIDSLSDLLTTTRIDSIFLFAGRPPSATAVHNTRARIYQIYYAPIVVVVRNILYKENDVKVTF